MVEFKYNNERGRKIMKNIKKMLIKILPVVFVLCIIACDVFAGNNIQIPNGSSGSASSKIKTATQKIWATVITIVQVLSVAAVVFAGVKYMVASADQKADIKRNLGVLTIGAILVFCATGFVKFVVLSANQILKR